MDIYGVTDIGCVRNANEDFIQWRSFSPDCHLAVLADGMGGYAGGRIASRLAVETFISELSANIGADSVSDPKRVSGLLADAGMVANRAVRERRETDPKLQQMGTTLVALLIWAENYWLIHAGDSRGYCWLEDSLQQLTVDHNVVQEMLEQGLIERRSARRAPLRNVLTRALGPEAELQLTVTHHAVPLINRGLCWLLCSDGLYNSVSESQLSRVLAENLSAREIAEKLVALSLRNNASDNVSVIVIKPN